MSVIAFLSDFGLKDPYAGIVKGVIAGINPAADITDITHGVPPQNITAGALMLAGSFSYFPPGTIFLAVVDPGVGSGRRGIILTHHEYTFVVPDNGLITGIQRNASNAGPRCWCIEEKRFFLKDVSSTFHARDIFGPVAAHISLGTRPEQFGPECRDPVLLDWPEPECAHGLIRGQVLYIDTFGNLITNIPASMLSGTGKRAIETARLSDCPFNIQVVNTYSDVEPGKPLCLKGSFGFMEIAVNQGNAALEFGTDPGAHVFIETG